MWKANMRTNNNHTHAIPLSKIILNNLSYLPICFAQVCCLENHISKFTYVFKLLLNFISCELILDLKKNMHITSNFPDVRMLLFILNNRIIEILYTYKLIYFI